MLTGHDPFILNRKSPTERGLVKRRLIAAMKKVVSPSSDGWERVAILSATQLLEARRSRAPLENLKDAEFRVFSQFGDDGIIQYLIQQVEPANDSFVELGVDDYSEANTRFLLVKDNWRGMIVDAGREKMDLVRSKDIHWRHDLTAVAAFITRDNVNDLCSAAGFAGPIGLLSIDIDGNDYWVWEALNVVEPDIVVIEYNSLFGAHAAVTVPYDPEFSRGRAHPSNLYWGASLAALVELGRRRGYAFVGSNSAGNNAFFVRRDRLGGVIEQTAASGYVQSRFREARNADGQLMYLCADQAAHQIASLPLVDVTSERTVRVGDIIDQTRS